jgi:hypothetical protein
VKAGALTLWSRFRALQPVAQVVIAVVVLVTLVVGGRVIVHKVHPLTCNGISKSQYPDWSDEEFKQACADTGDMGFQ